MLRQLNCNPLYLYNRSGDFALHQPDGIWVFDTILLNHAALQLCQDNVDQLAADGGILIGHVYLADNAWRGGQNCFKVDGEGEFLEAFRENVAHIGQMQKRGEVITLPLSELRKMLTEHAQSRVIRRADGWNLQCRGVVCSRTRYRIKDDDMKEGPDGIFSAEILGSALLADMA
jgi:hypothetical protein